MKVLLRILCWFAGVFFIIFGAKNIAQTPLIGIVALLIGILLIPLIYKIIYKLTRKKINIKIRSIITLSLLVIGIIVVAIHQNNQHSELEKNNHQTIISEFNPASEN